MHILAPILIFLALIQAPMGHAAFFPEKCDPRVLEVTKNNPQEVADPKEAKPSPNESMALKANSSTRAYEKRFFLKKTTPWIFDEKTEEDLVRISSESKTSLDDRAVALANALIEARLKQLNPLSRFFTKRAAMDGLKQKSAYSLTLGRYVGFLIGPHYSPIFNRTYIPDFGKDSPGMLQALSAVHEVEHAMYRNSNPIKSFFGLLTTLLDTFVNPGSPEQSFFSRLEETAAISSQWEWASRIHPEVRQEMIKALRELTPEKIRIHQLLEALESGLYQELKALIMFNDSEEAAEALAAMISGRLKVLNPVEYDSRKKEIGQVKDLPSRHFLQDLLENGFSGATVSSRLAERIEQQGKVKFSSIPTSHLQMITDAHKFAETQDLFKERLIQITISSLENAHLTKPEFLIALSPTHGHKIAAIPEGVDQVAPVRQWMMTQLLFTAISPPSPQHGSKQTPMKASDLKPLIELLNHL